MHRADDARLIETLVESGLGIALLPALARTGSEAVRFAEATPAPPRRHVTALVRSGAARRPSLAAVLEVLMRQASMIGGEAHAAGSAAAGPPGAANARGAASLAGGGPLGAADARDAAGSPGAHA